MLIGGCGLHWDRNLYEWNRSSGRKLLGQRPGPRGTVDVADFSAGRGLYLLHNPQGIYYVGLSIKYGRLSGRISDHTKDEHAESWDRFSWFSFDAPVDEVGDDGVRQLDDSWDHYGELETAEAIKDLEAIMIAALAPPGNTKKELFGEAEIWDQVANVQPPEVATLDQLHDRIARQ